MTGDRPVISADKRNGVCGGEGGQERAQLAPIVDPSLFMPLSWVTEVNEVLHLDQGRERGTEARRWDSEWKRVCEF